MNFILVSPTIISNGSCSCNIDASKSISTSGTACLVRTNEILANSVNVSGWTKASIKWPRSRNLVTRPFTPKYEKLTVLGPWPPSSSLVISPPPFFFSVVAMIISRPHSFVGKKFARLEWAPTHLRVVTRRVILIYLMLKDIIDDHIYIFFLLDREIMKLPCCPPQQPWA